jgi:hypothetical protein
MNWLSERQPIPWMLVGAIARDFHWHAAAHSSDREPLIVGTHQ